MIKKLRIATRSSQLALWQANWVKDKIGELNSTISVELILLKTKGDKILDTPLAKIGGKGLFVKELEVAILNREADIAVHSMKDVPTELPDGLEISVITKRETPNDAFVSNDYRAFDKLPVNAIVGTSSLRRIAQLQHLRPDITFKNLRGNVNTRLSKLDNQEYDAIILAAAGLLRLGLGDRISELISLESSLPAIGQGVICIESRVNDRDILNVINSLIDDETSYNIGAERALLCRLNGGCQVPLAGFAETKGDQICLTGLVASPDGSKFLKKSQTGPKAKCAEIGVQLAEDLLQSGGREILAEVGIETH